MAVTQSQSVQPASVSNVAVGRYITSSTAAAFELTTGFKPRYVKVQNLNASGYAAMEWYEGMAADSAVLTGIDGAISLITSLGITVGERGFTVGLQTDVNVINEQLSWMAIG
jgi:hypothetical protein